MTEPHLAMPLLLSASHGHRGSLLNDASSEEHLQIDFVEQRQVFGALLKVSFSYSLFLQPRFLHIKGQKRKEEEAEACQE